MKRTTALLLMSGLLFGCAVPTNLTPGNGNKPGTGASTAPGVPGTGPVRNQPLEPVNGVEFKAITAANSRFLGNGNTGGNLISGGAGNVVSTGAMSKAAAPAAASAPMSDNGGAMVSESSLGDASARSSGPGGTANVGGAYSGNVWSYYGYNYYFGGFGGGGEQMALVSLLEAETPGSKGSFQEIIASATGPVVKGWAKDARLIQSSAVVGNDGGAFDAPKSEGDAKMGFMGPMYGGGYYGDQAGWRLTYMSSSLSEVLTFTVTPAKTHIIRMKWAPLDLAPERVTVDASSALKKVIGAIEDRAFASEEEKTKLDYFLGFPYEQPKTGEYDGDYQKTEVLYKVPANARWNVNLQQVMGKLVWEMNFYTPYEETASGGVSTSVAMPAMKRPYPMDEPCEQPESYENSYVNNSAQGWVDAETGAVIRFTRPTKVTYKNQVYNTCPSYYPKPSASPVPAETPTPTPSATPSPTPTSTTDADTGAE